MYFAAGMLVTFLGDLFYTRWLRAIESKKYDLDREIALDVLDKHNIRAHYYFPAADYNDAELKKSLTLLGSRGYVFTSEADQFLGKVATARPTKDENVKMRRAEYRLVISK